MKETSIARSHCAGASMVGPSHTKSNLPNQDAYVVLSGSHVIGAAVSDGLGSCRFSREGARWATSVAMMLAMDHLLADPPTLCPHSRLEELKARILRTWRARSGQDYGQYDATLLFAVFTEDRGILGQIGDGLIVVCSKDGTCRPFARSNKAFLNTTESLANPNAMNLFKIEEIGGLDLAQIEAVFLMTDGVADDIADHTTFCRDSLAALDQAEVSRWNAILGSWLKEWPTPGHSDDKTLVVIRYGAEHKAVPEGDRPESVQDGGKPGVSITPFPSSATPQYETQQQPETAEKQGDGQASPRKLNDWLGRVAHTLPVGKRQNPHSTRNGGGKR